MLQVNPCVNCVPMGLKLKQILTCYHQTYKYKQINKIFVGKLIKICWAFSSNLQGLTSDFFMNKSVIFKGNLIRTCKIFSSNLKGLTCDFFINKSVSFVLSSHINFAQNLVMYENNIFVYTFF